MSEKMLCHRLAEHIISMRFDAIPREVVEKAKAVAAHDIAIAFGGVGTDQVNKALDLIEHREGAATIIGQSFNAAPIDAAFANTVATRALRTEDSIMPSFVHPGACQVPTALAFAEQHRRSGADVLTALVIGYDIVGKVAGSAMNWDQGYRCPSHIFGALGVAAAAAKLMGLDVEQTAGALAQACNLGAMVSVGMQDVQYGIVTRNGIFAAQLGKCRAPFAADALEGPFGFYKTQLHGSRPTDEEILGSLGERFEVMTAILKPHPCTGSNLVAIEIVRQQLRKHGLAGDDIRRIQVTRAPAYKLQPGVHNYGPFGGYGGGMYEATSSLPFALGTLMVDGEITSAHFLNANEPRTAKAMQRVHIEYRDDLKVLHDLVEIETANGQTITVDGDNYVLPAPDVAGFLNRYGRPVVGEAKVRDLQKALAEFEALPDIKALTSCLA